LRPEALTTEDYWKRETKAFRPFIVTDSPFASVLARHLPTDPRLSCVEVGAYPGGHLCYLTKRFGYAPTAIDFREDVDDIARLFAFNSLPPPNIIKEDFLSYSGEKFDIVTSFGFVEHFTDPQRVIRKHTNITRPRGYVVITVPHFWGLQALFRHAVLSTEALDELYRTHNFDIMHLGALKTALRKSGLRILFGGHIMNCSFWISPDCSKVRPERRWLARTFRAFDRRLGSRLPSCFLWSPMVMVIGKKD
jgi:SAM-dependent methyltransferase